MDRMVEIPTGIASAKAKAGALASLSGAVESQRRGLLRLDIVTGDFPTTTRVY